MEGELTPRPIINVQGPILVGGEGVSDVYVIPRHTATI